jgi:hypothetical protein
MPQIMRSVEVGMIFRWQYLSSPSLSKNRSELNRVPCPGLLDAFVYADAEHDAEFPR